ncbi:MAG: hypothetical protein K940chlam3_00037 [Chlamydiae bacterium]|nr:hypothetical protein [Chlamydiota bacterium]
MEVAKPVVEGISTIQPLNKFQGLPEEVVTYIFSFLSPRDVFGKISLTCKQFNRLIHDQSLIRSIFLRHWPHLLDEGVTNLNFLKIMHTAGAFYKQLTELKARSLETTVVDGRVYYLGIPPSSIFLKNRIMHVDIKNLGNWKNKFTVLNRKVHVPTQNRRAETYGTRHKKMCNKNISITSFSVEGSQVYYAGELKHKCTRTWIAGICSFPIEKVDSIYSEVFLFRNWLTIHDIKKIHAVDGHLLWIQQEENSRAQLHVFSLASKSLLRCQSLFHSKFYCSDVRNDILALSFFNGRMICLNWKTGKDIYKRKHGSEIRKIHLLCALLCVSL